MRQEGPNLKLTAVLESDKDGAPGPVRDGAEGVFGALGRGISSYSR
jgi:hypothetical protein